MAASTPARSSASPPASITALSPLDGRYAAKVAALRPLLSEYGLMHCRVRVEVAWFLALADARFAGLEPPAPAVRTHLEALVRDFSPADAEAIKRIERTTNHDVKAVEYWLRERFEAEPALRDAGAFIHFACTSEDINNASHALMVDGARRAVLLPALDAVIERLAALARGADRDAQVVEHGRLADELVEALRA